MLRQFLDAKGDIHFIAEGQEDSINPLWVEMERPSGPPAPIELPYNLKREREYPRITDQLDMLWHMMDDGTIPGKDSAWYNAILSVKNNYPKP